MKRAYTKLLKDYTIEYLTRNDIINHMKKHTKKKK